MQQIYLNSYFCGYNQFMKYIHNVANHPQKEVIEERLKIIKFFNQFGEEATKKAFGKARSTIYLWKQNLDKERGKLSALAPKSRTPKKRRQRETDLALIEFIKRYREKHPGVGKETIKTPLNAYADSLGLKTISESTIGRIIKDLKERGVLTNYKTTITVNGRTGRLKVKKIKRRVKLRRKGYTPEKPGDLIQIDAISIFYLGIKRYIITAIDLKSRFSFAYTYKTLSSLSAKDFMERLMSVAPFKIRRVQTDNGSEFHKYFENYLKEKKIVHFFNYPHYPKGNAYVERFNRTIEDQFVSHNMEKLFRLDNFNREMMEYLVWYNTEKQHKNLGKIPPLKYFLDNFIFNTKKSNMLWTLTIA